jgi:hypothetical protein
LRNVLGYRVNALRFFNPLLIRICHTGYQQNGSGSRCDRTACHQGKPDADSQRGGSADNCSERAERQ